MSTEPEPAAAAAANAARSAGGTQEQATRIERDSFGPIAVPADRLWGAQTQRSLQYFAVSTETWPRALIAALARVKGAAARVNGDLGLLAPPVAAAIAAAAD